MTNTSKLRELWDYSVRAAALVVVIFAGSFIGFAAVDYVWPSHGRWGAILWISIIAWNYEYRLRKRREAVVNEVNHRLPVSLNDDLAHLETSGELPTGKETLAKRDYERERDDFTEGRTKRMEPPRKW